VFLCAALLCVWPRSAPCQEAAPTPAQASPVNNDADDHRMFNLVPNYNTVNDPDQPIVPLSTGEKFALVEHYFDPFTFVFTSITAGFEQATNEKAGYGQGAMGYSKRYGADFTDGLTNDLFVIAVFPALLHQDPRYYRLGRGNGWKRTGYALSRILIGHSDSGAAEINASEFLGNFVSGALSMTYYPQNQRSISEVFTRMSVQIGYDSIFNVLKEFYPDLKRKFHHDH
jgi:hypothetical protein